jgi:hypothetical protein
MKPFTAVYFEAVVRFGGFSRRALMTDTLILSRVAGGIAKRGDRMATDHRVNSLRLPCVVAGAGQRAALSGRPPILATCYWLAPAVFISRTCCMT